MTGATDMFRTILMIGLLVTIPTAVADAPDAPAAPTSEDDARCVQITTSQLPPVEIQEDCAAKSLG